MSCRATSSLTAMPPSSTAVMSSKEVPERANGVRIPATTATRCMRPAYRRLERATPGDGARQPLRSDGLRQPREQLRGTRPLPARLRERLLLLGERFLDAVSDFPPLHVELVPEGGRP